MANGINFTNFLFPQQAADALTIQRQNAMAQQLMEQGSQPIDPSRTAGRYVVPVSPWEGAAKAGQTIAGALMAKNADEQTRKMYQGQSNALIQALTGQTPASATAAGQPTATAPTAPSAQPAGGGLLPPGMNPATFMFAGSLPDPLANVLLDPYKKTDLMKNDAYMGITPPQSRALHLGGKAKDMGVPGGMPNVDPAGNLSITEIPGAADAAAKMAEATKEAEQRKTIFTGQTINGMENVPVPGDVIFDAYQKPPVAPAAAAPATPGGLQSAPGGPVPLVGANEPATIPAPVAPPTAPQFGEDPDTKKRREVISQVDKQRLDTLTKQADTQRDLMNVIPSIQRLISEGTLGNAPAERVQMLAHEAGIAQTPETVNTANLLKLGDQLVTARGSLGTGVSKEDAVRYDNAAGNFSKAQSDAERIEAINVMVEIGSKFIDQTTAALKKYKETGELPDYQIPVAPQVKRVRFDAEGNPL